MKVRYDPDVGDLTIGFTPRDIQEYSLLMEFVHEDELRMGTCVPGFERGFWRKFSSAREKLSITFSPDYLEFCVSFLVKVWLDMLEKGKDTEAMEYFLEEVSPLCCLSRTVH